MTSILSGVDKNEYIISFNNKRCCDPKLLFNDLFFRMIKKNDEVYEPTIHHWRQMLSGALHHRLQSESKTDQHYVNSTFALKSKERHDKQR